MISFDQSTGEEHTELTTARQGLHCKVVIRTSPNNRSMKTAAALAILAICITTCTAIRWKDCGSKGAKVNSVMVTGCENSKICDLPKGTNVTFTVDFITNAAVEEAKSVVHGVIDHIPLPFPVKNPDACKDPKSGLVCPLKGNKSFSYTPKIFIMTEYPKVKVVVKWELQNSNGDDIFCVMVATEIVNGPKKTKHSNRTKMRSNRTHPKLVQLL